MADNPETPPAGSEPAEPQPTTPPGDQRPRPKYGELAPEGWTWSPPPGANPHGHVVPDAPSSAQPSADSSGRSTGRSTARSTARSAPHSSALNAPAPGSPYLGGPTIPKHSAAPAWDRPVTLALLVLGLLGLFSALAILSSVPEAVQMLYTQENLGTYTPGAAVPGLILAGKLTQGAIWVVTAVVSSLVLRRHRRAFYIPLIGGVLSVVAIFVFLSAVLATDPTLLNFYSGQ